MTAPQPPRVSGLDVAAMVACLPSVALAALTVVKLHRLYGQMFQDFGGPLPLVTRIWLQPAVPFLFALIGPLLVAGNVALDTRPRVRAAALAAVVVVTLLHGALFVAATYLPILGLASDV